MTGRADRIRFLPLLAGILAPLLTGVPAVVYGETPAAGADAPKPVEIERDPFRPYTLKVLEDRRQPERPRTPLEQYDLGSLDLVAVLGWKTENALAMVEDQAGKGYTIRVGTRIGMNGGVVKSIEKDRVVIEEESVDFYGETTKTQKVLRLRPEEEGSP